MFKYELIHHKFILENYKGIGNIELAELFNTRFKTNLKVSQIKSYKANRKLNSGVTGRFKKGHQTFNKGKKQTEYMSKESIEKTKKTRYKKGNIPIDTKEIGSEYIDNDGYLYIKVKDTGPRFGKGGMWQQYHHLVYMQYYGEIKKDHTIIFLDKDNTNFDIKNLKEISRSELLILNKNKMLTDHQEVNISAVVLAKLIDKQNKIKNKM